MELFVMLGRFSFNPVKYFERFYLVKQTLANGRNDPKSVRIKWQIRAVQALFLIKSVHLLLLYWFSHHAFVNLIHSNLDQITSNKPITRLIPAPMIIIYCNIINLLLVASSLDWVRLVKQILIDQQA